MNRLSPKARIRAARPPDREPVIRLLEGAGLPTVEVERWLPHYVVAETDGEVVGAAGLEVHGSDGVLRSVVVAKPRRGSGLGHRLVTAVVDHARDARIERLYLLTTTAADYFPRHGFRTLSRDDAPAAIRASVEFREACPASAVAMVLDVPDAGKTPATPGRGS